MKTKLKPALALLALGVHAYAASSEQVPGLAAQPASYFYTGKPYDTAAEAYSFAFRSYDPVAGRWTSADPSGFPDGVNGHTYAASPTSTIDPLGLFLAPITVGANTASGAPASGHTTILGVTTVASPQFSVTPSGKYFSATATLGYSFETGSSLSLPPNSGYLTYGGVAGYSSQTFRDDTQTHESWHGMIWAMAGAKSYGSLETWSSGYTSNLFKSSGAALAAAKADMDSNLNAAANALNSFWSGLGADGHDGIITGAAVNLTNQWTAINPNWGGSVNGKAAGLSVNFIKTPGDTLE